MSKKIDLKSIEIDGVDRRDHPEEGLRPDRVRVLNLDSILIEGIDLKDHPNYCDAYISYAEYTDGTPLDDNELHDATDVHGDLVNQIANESIYG